MNENEFKFIKALERINNGFFYSCTAVDPDDKNRIFTRFNLVKRLTAKDKIFLRRVLKTENIIFSEGCNRFAPNNKFDSILIAA